MQIKTILACIDFSDLTHHVLKSTASLAFLTEARVVVVHVEPEDPAFVGYEVGPLVERDFTAKHIREDHRRVEHLAQTIEAKGLDAEPLLVQGPPVRKILEQADRLPADLLVVGSHGHGAMYNLLMGSVAEGVLHKSHVPVLVVPTPKDRKEAGPEEKPASGERREAGDATSQASTED